MRLSPLLLLLLALQNAQASNSCPGFGDALRAITRNPNAVTIEGEREIAGLILEPGQRFQATHEKGFYVYLIDSKGRVIYSPRVPDMFDKVNPLATHRALLRQWKVHFPGETPQILAAGEFEISFNKVSELNNKANTFHGNETHLEYAKQILQQRGLPIERGTVLVDYATVTPAATHMKELAEMRLMQEHRFHSKTAEFVKIYHRIEEDVYRSYPSAVPGKPDWQKFFHSTEARIRTTPKQDFMDMDPGLFKVVQFLDKVSIGREFDFYLDRLIAAEPNPAGLYEKLRSVEGVFAD